MMENRKNYNGNIENTKQSKLIIKHSKCDLAYFRGTDNS